MQSPFGLGDNERIVCAPQNVERQANGDVVCVQHPMALVADTHDDIEIRPRPAAVDALVGVVGVTRSRAASLKVAVLVLALRPTAKAVSDTRCSDACAPR